MDRARSSAENPVNENRLKWTEMDFIHVKSRF